MLIASDYLIDIFPTIVISQWRLGDMAQNLLE